MTKTPDIHSPSYWRGRAEEMREAAALTRDPDQRSILVTLVDLYEQLARGAWHASPKSTNDSHEPPEHPQDEIRQRS